MQITPPNISEQARCGDLYQIDHPFKAGWATVIGIWNVALTLVHVLRKLKEQLRLAAMFNGAHCCQVHEIIFVHG